MRSATLAVTFGSHPISGAPRPTAPAPPWKEAGHGPLRFRLSPTCRLLLSFFFARLGLQSQSKNGLFAQAGNIPASRFLFARQIQRFTVLTTVDFHLVAKRLPDIATGLLQHIGQIEPALQVSAAQLALRVRLVAGALERLLIFHLMFRKLRGFCLRGLRHKCSIACCEEYLNRAFAPSRICNRASAALEQTATREAGSTFRTQVNSLSALMETNLKRRENYAAA